MEVEMARFRQAAATKPAKALKNLVKFGKDLARTFNKIASRTAILSEAARPLGMLLFPQASAALDQKSTGADVAALMNITVIQTGKLTVNQMLNGKITEEIILYE